MFGRSYGIYVVLNVAFLYLSLESSIYGRVKEEYPPIKNTASVLSMVKAVSKLCPIAIRPATAAACISLGRWMVPELSVILYHVALPTPLAMYSQFVPSLDTLAKYFSSPDN